MKNKDANILLNKYREGKATQEEINLLLGWIQEFGVETQTSFTIQHLDDIKNEMLQHLPALKRGRKASIWPRLAAAASILLFLATGYYFTFIHKPIENIAKNKVQQISPGGNRAVLTLADGKQVILTGAANGKLAVQGNVLVNKTADGDLTYENSGNSPAALAYNTLATPVGGQYHLTLADGTSVWLNALSSIKYPTDFIGNERKVEITGEAYFEVAHNSAKPFKVVSNNQLVEVLGTHFNINSYADEGNTKTTLLEGSVRVTGSGSPLIIKPGQQAVLQNGNISANKANLEEAVAWKNGYFRFNDERIKSVMKQLSRWYNIDVSYAVEMSDEGFNGKISRFRSLDQVLKMLEKTKAVHFKIEGRRVTVMQ